MKKLIILLLAAVFVFSGCNKEEKPKYDLALCDTALTGMRDYLSGFESESFVVEDIDFGSEQLNEYMSSMNENRKYITSVTVYSKNLTKETAEQLINFVKSENVPVIFAFSDIETETLTSYDKAFCITTDYVHAGEMTAVKLKQLWVDGTIADSDSNQIFSFSIVKNETENADLEDFYNTVIAGIELYGIPMQINSTVVPDEISDVQSLADLKASNEGVIVISAEVLPAVEQYTTESENIEIITMQQGVENLFENNSCVLNCFVNFKDYKTAADEILANYNSRQYPLIESSFFVKDRTVFIPATI